MQLDLGRLLDGNKGKRRKVDVRKGLGWTGFGFWVFGVLVLHFHRKAHVFNHLPDFLVCKAGCRQITVHEERVGDVERQGLKRAEIFFASTGCPDFRFGVEEPEEAENF